MTVEVRCVTKLKFSRKSHDEMVVGGCVCVWAGGGGGEVIGERFSPLTRMFAQDPLKDVRAVD